MSIHAVLSELLLADGITNTQNLILGLAIRRGKWRKYLGTCCRKLCGLVKAYKPDQTITINLDLECQLFSVANRSQRFDHVGACVESLYMPAGGLGLNVEFNDDMPLENMVAVLDAVEKYRNYKG